MKTTTVEVGFKRGNCGATVKNGKFAVAYVGSGGDLAIFRRIDEIDCVIRDLQEILAEVRKEINK